jgi:predicted nucleic acid-binding protein
MIAVDTNILVHLWLPTDKTTLSENVFTIDRNWIAPFFWRSEFRNVVGQYIKRGLPFEDGMKAIDNAEDIMDGHELEGASRDIMELVRISGCTAYDCEFIHVAKLRSVPLVTLDKELLTKFPRIAISPHQFIETFERS